MTKKKIDEYVHFIFQVDFCDLNNLSGLCLRKNNHMGLVFINTKVLIKVTRKFSSNCGFVFDNYY